MGLHCSCGQSKATLATSSVPRAGQCLRRRYRGLRTCTAKGFVALYLAFNSQVSFPRVLRAMAEGGGHASACTLPFVLRYINAQPLLTSGLTTMVRRALSEPN